MKALFIAFVSTTLFFFTSCTPDAVLGIEAQPITETYDEENYKISPAGKSPEVEPANLSLTIQLQAYSYSVSAGMLTVNFSGDDDYTNTTVEDMQDIDFKDGSGKPTRLTFDVDSYSGRNEKIDITFDLNGQSLAGLQMDAIQYIVIQDDIIN
jgi:hypothetical protein